MSLDQLWAGWRASYVASVGDGDSDLGTEGFSLDEVPEGSADCVFCRIISSDESDELRHVVWSGTTTTVLLNAYPYSSGHVLVMPKRHVSNLEDLDPIESAELWEATRGASSALQSAYSPDGLNLGANLGRAAGAGIPGHLHLHVLPRWLGDTNFMTTVASVRVMPEALSDSWAKLRLAWPK